MGEGEELRFTGNWFIDAGILGFVNLMEEVYGWDMGELQRRIREEPEKVYYGYFPFAYMFRRSIISGIYKQQRELRSLIKKAETKKQETINKLSDKEKKLKSEKSSKKTQKIQGDIKRLQQQVNELDRLIYRLSGHISLLEEIQIKVKQEFKKRVEEILKDYMGFSDQYNNYLINSEWVYHVVPKDMTTELNEKLEDTLDHAVKLKLLTVGKKTNNVERILKMLPDNERFVIHPNANERNFYLYNPPKEDEYTILIYLMALLREDIDKIKLLLGIKYKRDSFRERLAKFLGLCKQNNLSPTSLVHEIESAINIGIPKSKALNHILKKYKVQASKEELREFLSDIYTNFRDIINRRGQLITYEMFPDSTINPFLFSPGEFPNVSYTSLPGIKELKKLLPAGFPAYILFLTFFESFFPVYGNGIMFYVPELVSCYSINKRIRTKIELSKGNFQGRLLKIAWSAIIDELVETKSRFSLENMYLVEANVSKNKLNYVEYIGIPKLHASIILDDEIREAINTSLRLNDSNTWLLGEFINQKPLYPLILKHIWNGIKENNFINWKASLYALAIDAKLRSESSTGLFGDSFFKRAPRAAIEVKDFYHEMTRATMALKRISPEIGEKNLIYPLLSALRRHNRNAFVNILLKALLQSKDKASVSAINSYLFRRVLTNDEFWEDFALALVVGLVGGGEDVGSGEDVEED